MYETAQASYAEEHLSEVDPNKKSYTFAHANR